MEEITDAVYDGQLGAWDDEVDAVGLGKGDEIGVGDICGEVCGGGARIPGADIDVADEGRGREAGGEGVLSPASTKQQNGKHRRGNPRMGYDLHNPAGPPFYRNFHLLPPSRSRNNSQSTPDNVDLLDLTDPWGTSWHHTSPYDFGIRPRRASTPAVSASIPQPPSALPNIHLPRKLSKRQRPQPTKHISVLGRLVRTLSHMRRSFTPHRPDPTPPPPPPTIDNDAASFVSVDAPFSIGKLTIANPDDPEPPSPVPPTLPAKDDPLSSIPFPDRPTSYLSYADTPMSGISVLANPPTPCARVINSPAVDIDDHARAMEWEERDRREREERERGERGTEGSGKREREGKRRERYVRKRTRGKRRERYVRRRTEKKRRERYEKRGTEGRETEKYARREIERNERGRITRRERGRRREGLTRRGRERIVKRRKRERGKIARREKGGIARRKKGGIARRKRGRRGKEGIPRRKKGKIVRREKGRTARRKRKGTVRRKNEMIARRRGSVVRRRRETIASGQEKRKKRKNEKQKRKRIGRPKTRNETKGNQKRERVKMKRNERARTGPKAKIDTKLTNATETTSPEKNPLVDETRNAKTDPILINPLLRHLCHPLPILHLAQNLSVNHPPPPDLHLN